MVGVDSIAAPGGLAMSSSPRGGYGDGVGEGGREGEGVSPGPDVAEGWGEGTGVGDAAASAAGVAGGGVTVAPSFSSTPAAVSRLSWTARTLGPADCSRNFWSSSYCLLAMDTAATR